MNYYIGQALGLIGTLCCLILPFMKKKWQMLALTALVNVFCALNLVLIGEVGSVILIYVVAVVQTIVALWHLKRDTAVTRAENIIFLVLYVVCGALDLGAFVDAIPIVGAVFHMLATFQRDVQKTRVLLLFNSLTFMVYYALVGSTSVFSTLVTMTSTLLAMYHYRKKKTTA
ncbi:MAG: YgjV family protein [Oscillospiraceae bacterium]|nr:YgjV family protein [Oscillospiraceae bacterium]